MLILVLAKNPKARKRFRVNNFGRYGNNNCKGVKLSNS